MYLFQILDREQSSISIVWADNASELGVGLKVS